jgi:hypothetical protein
MGNSRESDVAKQSQQGRVLMEDEKVREWRAPVQRIDAPKKCRVNHRHSWKFLFFIVCIFLLLCWVEVHCVTDKSS